MNLKNPNSRCKAHAKTGNRCRAAATEGGLCFFHGNPNKAAELGRIGGRRNRHAAEEATNPLPTLDNVLAVRNAVARLIADVYSGNLQPRVAAGLAPLLNLQLRAIETTDLERRLAHLEKLLAEAKLEQYVAGEEPAPELDWGNLPPILPPKDASKPNGGNH